jgi:nucleoside phosphorylase
MAFVTINGRNYPVAIGNASEDAPTFIGALTRAFAGNLRRTVRALKHQWTFTLGPLYQYEDDLLETDVGSTASVTVTGDALANVAVTAAVILGSSIYIPDDPLFRRLRQVTVMEV